jgi:hypothetical protein
MHGDKAPLLAEPPECCTERRSPFCVGSVDHDPIRLSNHRKEQDPAAYTTIASRTKTNEERLNGVARSSRAQPARSLERTKPPPSKSVGKQVGLRCTFA